MYSTKKQTKTLLMRLLELEQLVRLRRQQVRPARHLPFVVDGRRPSSRPSLASFGIVVVADDPFVLLAIGYGPVASGRRTRCTSASSRTALGGRIRRRRTPRQDPGQQPARQCS